MEKEKIIITQDDKNIVIDEILNVLVYGEFIKIDHNFIKSFNFLPRNWEDEIFYIMEGEDLIEERMVKNSLLKLAKRGYDIRENGGWVKYLEDDSLINEMPHVSIESVNYIGGDNYGNQFLAKDLDNPIIKQTADIPNKNPEQKKSMWLNPWIVSIGMFIVEEIIFGFVRNIFF